MASNLVTLATTGTGVALEKRTCRITILFPTQVALDYADTTGNKLVINGSSNAQQPGNRVKFKVKKSREKEPNTCEVAIVNLTEQTRRNLQQKGVKLLLEAGYAATGLTRLFYGDVRTVDHRFEKPIIETVMRIGDGERGYRWAFGSESFGARTQAADVLKYLGKQLGLDPGNVAAEAAKINVRFDQGYVVFGPVQQELDRLLTSIGWEYSIQDGALQVLQTDDSLTGVAIPLISPTTGLIGSPEMGTPEKKGKPALLKIKSYLLATRPGAMVQVKSDRYNGQVTVKKCEYEGDTRGPPWYTHIEGVLQPQVVTVTLPTASQITIKQ